MWCHGWAHSGGSCSIEASDETSWESRACSTPPQLCVCATAAHQLRLQCSGAWHRIAEPFVCVRSWNSCAPCISSASTLHGGSQAAGHVCKASCRGDQSSQDWYLPNRSCLGTEATQPSSMHTLISAISAPVQPASPLQVAVQQHQEVPCKWQSSSTKATSQFQVVWHPPRCHPEFTSLPCCHDSANLPSFSLVSPCRGGIQVAFPRCTSKQTMDEKGQDAFPDMPEAGFLSLCCFRPVHSAARSGWTSVSLMAQSGAYAGLRRLAVACQGALYHPRGLCHMQMCALTCLLHVQSPNLDLS